MNKNNKTRSLLYPKLAAENIRKNAKTYIPYIITCIVTISMFYIICSMSYNEGLTELKRGASVMPQILTFGSVVVGIFAVIFLFYTNSFLMKKRKKEFGLYNILGMEKRHIAKIVAFETLYVSVISLVLGFILGIALDKATYLLAAKIIGVEPPMGFYISAPSMIISVILFGAIFLIILLNSFRQIHFANTIELLKGGNVGEKEPKTKWVMTVLGIICLGLGYAIAVTVEGVAEAVAFFFTAVILVIVGTYMLFTAGSVFILKALKKNKRYYYKAKHFISVSGMIYRMKQNAVGLANICILSTMVLVMISSITSLMFGLEDALKANYPNDIVITARNIYMEYDGATPNENAEELNQILESYRDSVKKSGDFYNISFNCPLIGNKVTANEAGEYKSTHIQIITAEDRNKYSDEKIILDENSVYMIITKMEFDCDTVNILGEDYNVAGKTFTEVTNDAYEDEEIIFVVKDMSELMQINDRLAEEWRVEYENESFVNRTLMYNITDKDRAEEIMDTVQKNAGRVSVDDIFSARDSYIGIYGGLFFLGIFLGILFIMATILIIYYKQISEGYDDKERFEIMQKVGMAKSEVKSSIRSQVLCVFFLPLITAGIHLCFAFPLVSKVLTGFGLTNLWLYIVCAAVTFLIFAIVYVIIYSLTARVYYKIVS